MDIRKLIKQLESEISELLNQESDNASGVNDALKTLEYITNCVDEIETQNNIIGNAREVIREIVY